MKFGTEGFPLIILSHRKRRFIEQAVASLRGRAVGITDVIVVDDSGDHGHHQWLDDHGYQYTVVDPRHRAGYLRAMTQVWCTAKGLADETGSEYVMLWEEDFLLTHRVDLRQMALVMERNDGLAHLNLQRNPVYPIEKRYGYMESHNRRGYMLSRNNDDGLDWVARMTPFTTNPGLIRREVLDIDWPSREVCDNTDGGAEPAMGKAIEEENWYFGWFGKWNTPHTMHVGHARKSGTGY